MQQSKTILSIITLAMLTIILGVGIFFIARAFSNSNEPQSAFTNIEGLEEFDGSTSIESPQIMFDFTLINQDDEVTRLSDLQGKMTLLSFGFTHCPDVCPLTLGEFRAIQSQLGEDAEQVNFVFISVDGSRDTPDVLKRYLELQQVPDFIALTGDEDYLREVGKDYDLRFEADEPDADGNYQVAHTAGSFLFDEDGRWIMRYSYGIERTIIVNDIREFLAN